MKVSIKEKRLNALYDYSRRTSKQRDLLELLLAIIPHSTVKKVCEELNLKIK